MSHREHPLDLSVVVPARNAAATLPAQLDALRTQQWDGSWEIVVVDNGSTDATPELLDEASRQDPRVRVLRAPEVRGPAHARNRGAGEARGRALAFCDADDVVAPGWVAAMGGALATAPFVCGPLELATLNDARVAASRGTGGTQDVARFEGRIPFASSCNVGIVREVLTDSGGFDESLRVGEDIDLSMRMYLQQVPLIFVPDAVVHYRYRATDRENFAQAVDYGAVRPLLAERWRARTGEQLARWRGARTWLWLLRHAPMVLRSADRAEWLWVLGRCVGTLRGSLRVRRLYV